MLFLCKKLGMEKYSLIEYKMDILMDGSLEDRKSNRVLQLIQMVLVQKKEAYQAMLDKDANQFD